MKTRQITMTEAADGTRKIVSFANCIGLRIGQVVSIARCEYWVSLPDVRIKVIAAPAADTKQDDLDHDGPPAVETWGVSDDPWATTRAPDAGDQALAREFDILMLDAAPDRNWAPESILMDALQPDPGPDHRGTGGIKLRIARSEAIALIRRSCAREIGLDIEEIGAIKTRAAGLEKLKEFLTIPTPF